jgi:hypothetical protein
VYDVDPCMRARVMCLMAAAAAGCGSPATPREPTNASATPCFADAPPLAARDIHQTLEKHSWWLPGTDQNEAPPPEPFGTCTAHKGKVTAADGTLVAELGCGVHVYVRGIHDELGLGIGATGADVIARWNTPHGPMQCFNNGPGMSRCSFDRPPDGDTDLTSYVVAAELPAGTDVLTGDAAERLFAPREIVQFMYSAWCH